MEEINEQQITTQSGENSTKDSKSSSWVYILVVVILIGLGGFFMFNNSKKITTENNKAMTTNDSASNLPVAGILLSDIESHNTREDCWTTIDGGVYDVTKFISKHKGGDKILLACGKDASDMFNGKAPMSRVHSEIAKKLLSGMKIGDLQK